MKRMKNEKGFTLVELAIVMAIIGLLIGGILKGQELMENARIASTVSQVKSYEAAVTTFRDTFNAMPGDMANAITRLPNCAGTCAPTAATAGNQVVGAPDMAGSGNGVTVAAALPAAVGGETTLFWVHMLLADLIGGTTDQAVRLGGTGGASVWGETHPAAKIGGGFFVGHSDGNAATDAGAPGTANMPGRPAGASQVAPVGTVLILRNTPGAIVNTTAGIQPLSPLRAAQIDRKIDDGQPDTGTTQAYGTTATCFGAAAPFVYNEQSKSKDCGLIIQIQG